MNVRKQYSMIDISKFICALLVVFIHSYETPRDNMILQVISKCFTKQAVPFFFIASGFFFGVKIYNSKDQLKVTFDYCKKMLLLYVAWALLWLPQSIVSYIRKDGANLYTLFVLLRRYLLAGEGVYWYILVLVESAAVVGLLIKYKKERLLLCIALIGFVLGMLYNINLINTPIDTLFYLVFSWSNNFIMMGIPYFSIGVYLSQKDIHFKQFNLVILYLVVSILNVLIYVLTRNGTLAIFYPLQASVLFAFSKNSSLNCNAIVYREISSALFFLHTIFIYTIIDHYLGYDANDLLRWGVAVMLSILSYYLIKKLNYKPLKYLISAK